MFAIPVAMPLTTPVNDPIVAIAILLLVHVPAPTSDNVVVEPTQTSVIPVIEGGEVFTVTVIVVKHPVVSA